MAEGPVIGAADVAELAVAAPSSALDYHGTVAVAVDQAERALLERALAAAGQNRTRAARLLGIGRRTLLYKLRRHAIGRPHPKRAS
jgi:DNA-binding NtrC family response regulator